MWRLRHINNGGIWQLNAIAECEEEKALASLA